MTEVLHVGNFDPHGLFQVVSVYTVPKLYVMGHMH